jgi:hypothetical protein
VFVGGVVVVVVMIDCVSAVKKGADRGAAEKTNNNIYREKDRAIEERRKKQTEVGIMSISIPLPRTAS